MKKIFEPIINLPRKTKLILVAGLISTIILLFLTSLLNPPQQNLPNTTPLKPLPKPTASIINYKQFNTPKIAVSFSKTNAPIPESLPMYSAKLEQLVINDLTNNFVSQLGLSSSGVNSWTSPDKNKNLSSSPKDRFIDYYSVIDFTNIKSGPQPDQAYTTLSNFISNSPLGKYVTINKNTISYLKADENHLEPSTRNNYSVINFNIEQLVNGLPIYFDDSNQSRGYFIISPPAEIYKFFINPTFVSNITQTESVKIKTLTEAVDAVKNNGGYTVDNSFVDIATLKLTDLPLTTLTDFMLFYRFDTKTQKLEPYYMFTGNYTLNSNESTVTIFVPAAK